MDEWFRIFSGMSGKSMDDIFDQMVNEYMVNMLKQLRGDIDQRIIRYNRKSSTINPFTILGCEPNATEAEVKSAYKKKAHECHPDLGGSADKFKQVQAAYEAICMFKNWQK
jgi:DnaJ-domain-containing protein 1